MNKQSISIQCIGSPEHLCNNSLNLCFAMLAGNATSRNRRTFSPKSEDFVSIEYVSHKFVDFLAATSSRAHHGNDEGQTFHGLQGRGLGLNHPGYGSDTPSNLNLSVTCGFKNVLLALPPNGENVARFLGIPTILLRISMNLLLHSFSTGTSYPFHPKWEPVIWGAGHHFLLSHYGPGTCYLLGLGTLQLVLLFP